MVLMDCHMSDMDGFEATKAIRELTKENKVKYIPIVALTARALKGDKEECLKAGMRNNFV